MAFFGEGSRWVCEPRKYSVEGDSVEIVTEPGTDLWQRTYYGFRNDNAPALLRRVHDRFFSFTVKVEFDSTHRFDQCGVIIYQDSDNWFKASAEYENEDFQRLGSVVTNHGYSDWATVDIPASLRVLHYRLSRRESDYRIECSYDGANFSQLRVFHLFAGGADINLGIYACSPEASTFVARFSEPLLSECVWDTHI